MNMPLFGVPTLVGIFGNLAECGRLKSVHQTQHESCGGLP